MSQNRYLGSCHCGAVTFVLESPAIVDAMRCNCSICLRKGALLSNFVVASDKLTVSTETGALARYEFGNRLAKHYFCSICGIFTHVSTLLNPGHFRVNLGCIDNLDVVALPVIPYDGKSL
ncbi:MAG: GFA family protein [Pseudomonadota bacterium]